MKYGENSRVDFLLEDPTRRPCYLEVKNVHLMRKPRLAEFPDSVTERGAKHLVSLPACSAAARAPCSCSSFRFRRRTAFAVARDIDPAYAAAFDRARARGVEMLAWRCKVTLDGIEIAAPVPIVEPKFDAAARIACVARAHAYIIVTAASAVSIAAEASAP